MICSNCGMILIPGAKVCGNCGQPVISPSEKAEDAADVVIDVNAPDDIKSESSEKSDKDSMSERSDDKTKNGKSETYEQADISEEAEKTDKSLDLGESDESENSDKSENTGKTDKSDRSDKTEKTDRPDKSEKKRKKDDVLYYDADEYPDKADDILDADFVEVDENGTKLPGTELAGSRQLSKKTIIAVIAGSASAALILIIVLISLFSKNSKKTVKDDGSYGETAINVFFEGMSNRDSAACYDIVRGHNSSELFDVIDSRIKSFSGIEVFRVQNYEVTEKKSLGGDYLRSMEINSALDLDKAYICEVTFQYYCDGVVMPGRVTLRTAKTQEDGKWWIIYADFYDIISETIDFFEAYNSVNIDSIIDGFAAGVKSDAEIKELRDAYSRMLIKNRGLTIRKLTAYTVSDKRLNEIKSTFDKELSLTSVCGFTIDAKYKEQGETVKEQYDIVMAFIDKKWKVISFSIN
ncbi:MAG: hypothetical protein IJJ89_05345 [Eubacterium sp.]|nr:hypothetical protein [Eubacterium sp.]